MSLFIPRVNSFHWFMYSESGVNHDGNYLLGNLNDTATTWKQYMNAISEYKNDASVYSLETTDIAHFQIADDEAAPGNDFLVPFPVEIRIPGTAEGIYAGWVHGSREEGIGYWTSFNLAIGGIGYDAFYLRILDRDSTPVVITDYDNLTFDTDTADYVTGPSHTASWDGTTFHDGAGSCKIDVSAFPVSGDEVILELPNPISLTTTRTYIISGWVRVDTTNPCPGNTFGFNPKYWYPDCDILDVVAWNSVVDEWQFIYTIFRVNSIPMVENIGLCFSNEPNPSAGTFTISGNSAASSINTDTWSLSILSRDILADSEPVCISANPLPGMKLEFSCGVGSTAFGCAWTTTNYKPMIRVPGHRRAISFDIPSVVAETSNEGDSVLPSIEIRKSRILKAGPMPEWLTEMLVLGLGCDTVTINGIDYCSTGEEPDVSSADDKDLTFKVEANVYPKAYPYGFKGV